MITYQMLLDKISAFCDNHIIIQKNGVEFIDYMPNFATESEKYPLIFVEHQSSIESLDTTQFSVNVYCMDVIQKNRENLTTIVSDCHLILRDMHLYFQDGEDWSVDVIGSPSMSALNDQDLDYTAGWVMSITFEMASSTECEIPIRPIIPVPPFTCPDSTYEITDDSANILYSGIIASGGTLNQSISDSSVVIKDDSANVLYTVSVNAEGSVDQVVSDSSVTITDDSANVLYSLSVNAEGSATQPISDSVVNINNSASTLLHSVSVNAEGTASQIVSDSSVTNSDTSYSVNVLAEGSLVLPDSTINVNSVGEGSVVSVKTIDINVTDSLGAVTPDSVSIVGNTITIDVPDAPPSLSTATLMRTGQTTVFRTGDDGSIQAGRATSFLVLAENNPFGTTARFTDELGGSTYTNNWAIDWSTFNGSNVLGYFITLLKPTDLAYATNAWNDMIDSATIETFGTFTGCRLANKKECENLIDANSTTYLSFSPFTYFNSNLVTSTTYAPNTLQSWQITTNSQISTSFTKTTSLASNRGLVVRTFTVTGTTLT